MRVPRSTRYTLRGVTALVLAFLYVPLLVVVVLSFNTSESLAWPPKGFTFTWWSKAVDNSGARSALFTSLRTALAATVIALVLGTLASFAVHKHRFFGRDVVSFFIVLPIALPGIVTGIALNSGFNQLGIGLGYFTLIVAHATFCIVIVYNNLLARLRRLSASLTEASADLGAAPLATFRHVTFPLIRSALLAGVLLALGLSFDEIVVTTFTAGPGIETLPQWILNNLTRPNQIPIVNVVATFVVLLSVLPVWAAQKLTGEAGGLAGR